MAPRYWLDGVADPAPYLYDDFARSYAHLTDDPAQIGAIWEFDRTLSLVLLDYALLSEQLFKAALARVAKLAHPLFWDDFERHGVARAVKNTPAFARIDQAILLKAKAIAEEMGVERVGFGTLINYLSLNAFKKLVAQLPPDLFLAFLHECNKNAEDPLTPDGLLVVLELMHLVRNVAAHNGQLLRRPTVARLLRIAETPNLSGVFALLSRPLARAKTRERMMADVRSVLEAFADVNERYRLVL